MKHSAFCASPEQGDLEGQKFGLTNNNEKQRLFDDSKRIFSSRRRNNKIARAPLRHPEQRANRGDHLAEHRRVGGLDERQVARRPGGTPRADRRDAVGHREDGVGSVLWHVRVPE